MKRQYKHLHVFLILLELVLCLFPLLTMEAQHARQCQSTLSLWNDSIVVEDPALWSNVWLGGALLHLTCKATISSKSKGKGNFFVLPAAVKRQCYMFVVLAITRVMIAVDLTNMCVYSLPLCFLLLVTCESLISLAKA